MKKKFNRYVVFAYDTYYPTGGMTDVCVSVATLKAAKKCCSKLIQCDCHILDLEKRIVLDSKGTPESCMIK